MGSLSLLQGIFPTQGSNPGLPSLQADSIPAEPPGKQNREVDDEQASQVDTTDFLLASPLEDRDVRF